MDKRKTFGRKGLNIWDFGIGKVQKNIFEDSWGNQVVMLQDPDGHLIEVAKKAECADNEAKKDWALYAKDCI